MLRERKKTVYANKVMRTRLQTIIDTESTTVLLLSKKSVFLTQLCKTLESVHLHPFCIDPDQLIKDGMSEEQRKLFSACYMCVWLDIPVFTPQQQKTKDFFTLTQILQKSLHSPLLFVTFDSSCGYKNGATGQGPLSASSMMQKAVSDVFQSVRSVTYQHVVYPYEGGLSVVMRFLMEKYQSSIQKRVEGLFSPVWYEDVLSHLVSLICVPTKDGGIFEGKQVVHIEAVDQELLKRSRLTVMGKTVRFPFVFPNGVPIGNTSVSSMVSELAAIVPQKNQRAQPDVAIVKPVFLSPKQKKQSAISRIFHWILRVVLSVFLLYVGLIIVYISLFFTVRERLKTVAAQPKLFSDQVTLSSLAKPLRYIQKGSQYIPFSSVFLASSVDSSRVTQGITLLSTYVEMVLQHQSHVNDLFVSKQWSVSDSAFEEVFTKLSFVQSSLSGSDLTIDMVFGMDGFSAILSQELSKIRLEIAQDRLYANAFSKLVGHEKEQTVVFVELDSEKRRPVFGTPKEVFLSEIKDGVYSNMRRLDPQTQGLAALGIVQPPQELYLMLGENHWKSSLGAWSIDGRAGMRELLWLLSKETQKNIDTIIAYSFPKDVLVDPEVRAASSLVRALPTSTNDSTQKLLSGFVGKDLDSMRWFVDRLANGQATIFSKDQSIQKSIESLGFDGRLYSPLCPTAFSLKEHCVVSTRYLGIYDLSTTVPTHQKHTHRVTITQDAVFHEDETQLLVASGSIGRRLLKLAIDADAHIQSVRLDAATLRAGEYSISGEFDRKVVTILIDDVQNTQKTLTVSYSTKGVPPTNSAFAFFAQKQLGDTSPFTLDVRYPKNYNASTISPAGVVNAQRVVFPSDFSSSRLFAVGF